MLQQKKIVVKLFMEGDSITSRYIRLLYGDCFGSHYTKETKFKMKIKNRK